MKRLSLSVLLATLVGSAAAQQAATIPLWPGSPPGGAAAGPQQETGKGSITQVAQPYLIVHRAAQPNGTAVLLISGGGYAHIEAGKESGPTAAWLQSQGISAFELVYRLPQEGGGVTAPFQDGQRAMRLIRAHASEWKIDPARIGILGFSAGGHLAGMTAARPAAPLYAPVDAADTVSARPDFAVLLYPVLTMQKPYDTTHAKKSLLGAHPTKAERDAMSVELQVTPQMPPTFLAQAEDDPISPPENSRLMDAALRKAGVPVKLQMFQQGGHGWGLGKPGSDPAVWPQLFMEWVRGEGFVP